MSKEFSIQKLINEAVREDRGDYKQTSWHASALGSCLTGAYLVRKGVCKKEFDDRTLRVFQVGNMFEDFVVDILKDQDIDFETQVRCEWDEMDLTGYADIVISRLVYEVKSKHSRGMSYTPNRHHEQQLWAYLKCLGIDEGRLLYLSKDDMRIKEHPVFLNDEELKAEVVEQLEVLNEAWEKELPPEPVRDKDDWRMKYCDVHKDHCLKQDNYLPNSLI